MNITILIIVSSLSMICVILSVIYEVISSYRYRRAHKQWSILIQMGLIETAFILKSSRMNGIYIRRIRK